MKEINLKVLLMKKWHWVVLGLLSIMLAPLAIHRLVADYWMGHYENDFLNYYDAATRWLAGGNLYAVEQGFIYPPPAVLLFVPLTVLSCHSAYIVFSALSYFFLIAAITVTMGLFQRSDFTSLFPHRGEVPPINSWSFCCPMLVFWMILSLALAPTFENAAWGQVNTLVLLCSVVFFWLWARNRPLLAGLVLAAGTWIKVYPALLLWVVVLGVWRLRQLPAGRPPVPFGEVRRVFSNPSFRAISGFGLGLLLIPLLLLPWLSPGTYHDFFAQVLPGASGIIKPRIMNQSFIGAMGRWSLGPVDTLLNTRIPMSVWIDATNKILLVAVLVGLWWWCRGRPPGRILCAKVFLLACIPVFSPLGWCYVYVLTYPLIFLAIITAQTWLQKSLVLAGILAFTIPAHHVIPGAHHMPLIVQHLLYSRYLPATVLLVLVVLWTERVSLETEATIKRNQ